MQRRAAAAYVTFFIVVGAAAYGVVATAESPTVTIDDPDHELGEGDSLTVDGRTYTVAAVEAERSSGGAHGGGGGIERSASLAWENESALFSETWEPGDEVTVENRTFVAVIRGEDPSSVTLREPLGEDVETVERNGTTFVVVDRDGDGTEELVPVEEYEPLDRRTFREGTLQFRGNRSTLNVTAERARFQWGGTRTETVDVGGGENVTLNGVTYFAYFPENGTLQLTREYADYAEDVRLRERFHERENGLWGVTILSWFAAALLIGLAFLPHKET